MSPHASPSTSPSPSPRPAEFARARSMPLVTAALIAALFAPTRALATRAAAAAPALAPAREPALVPAISPVRPLAAPSSSAFGAPCLCFALKSSTQPSVPENALAQADWNTARVCDEALRLCASSTDAFARAETVRRALLELQKARETKKGDVQHGIDALLDGLDAQVKRATELARCSRALLVPANGMAIDAAARERARAALQALAGVQRVELQADSAALVAWFDAARVSSDALAAAAGFATHARVDAPSSHVRALALLTLAYAGEATAQLGGKPDFDPLALAREAAALRPDDAALALVAGMVLFHRDADGAAVLGANALRLGRDDELVAHNLRHVYGPYFGASSLEGLAQAWEKRVARR